MASNVIWADLHLEDVIEKPQLPYYVSVVIGTHRLEKGINIPDFLVHGH
jgi:hypothetical protein